MGAALLAATAVAQSLDELLGIEEPPPAAPAPPADAPDDAPADPPAAPPADGVEVPPVQPPAQPPATDLTGEDLDSLTAADALERVVTEMAEAAALLEAGDTGLPTQRLQQRVIDRLEQVIAAASRPSGGGGGGEGGDAKNQDSQPGQQPGGQPQGGQQAGGQPGAGSQQSGPPQGGGASGGDATASSGTAAEAQAADRPLDELRSEWGGLPPRLREALSEGLDEPYSPTWREATEAYYRRLAEESNR